MRVISLGWGVQSWGLTAMSALGVLPKVDVAIHADTTYERSETYDFARRWTPWLEDHGVRVVTVENERTNVVENYTATSLMIPAYTAYENDIWVEGGDYVEDKAGDEIFIPDGTHHKIHSAGSASGILRRQCTHDWKISPIRRWLQANRDKEPVEMWLGITLDEVTRMKPSDVQYITHAFPLIELLDRPWTRGMVMRWLQENGLEIPVKSACVFCPFHNRAGWRDIKLADNGNWQQALEVDDAIRHKRPGYVCYLIPERIPLADADFRNEEDHGQLSLWDSEECEGMCFL